MNIVTRGPRNGMNRNLDVWHLEIVSDNESYLNVFENVFLADIDTDELDSDTKNVEEEIVEFFIKEEVTEVE